MNYSTTIETFFIKTQFTLFHSPPILSQPTSRHVFSSASQKLPSLPPPKSLWCTRRKFHWRFQNAEIRQSIFSSLFVMSTSTPSQFSLQVFSFRSLITSIPSSSCILQSFAKFAAFPNYSSFHIMLSKGSCFIARGPERICWMFLHHYYLFIVMIATLLQSEIMFEIYWDSLTIA